MVLEGSCQKVPLGEPNDSGQWRKTVEAYMAETECRRDGIVWCWVGGIGRGAGGWWENEGKSALTSSRTVLLDVPTGLEARHSYLWEDRGWLSTLFMKNSLVKSELDARNTLWNTVYCSPNMPSCISDTPASTCMRGHSFNLSRQARVIVLKWSVQMWSEFHTTSHINYRSNTCTN